MKSLKLCTIGAALALMVTAVCQAAVEKAAFLQGSQLEGGGVYLDSATPTSIAWNERSSIDPSVFEHDINSIHRLTVLEDGDYIVAATMPVVAIDTADNRPSQEIEIYVNGEPAPGSQGRTGYIRNQPRNTNIQDETSCHAHLLLQGLSAGDVIEVKAAKTAQPAQITAIQTASLFVEKAESGRAIFSAVSDDSLDGVNLNPDWEGAGEDPVELPWASNRKDSGFSHSDGGAGISLSSGTYLVYVNLPLQRTSGARLSPSLEILLDGNIVPGGQSRHGYNRNASGHIESSVHFAGIVEVSGNQTLTTQTLRYANSGNTGNAVLPTGKKGSIMIEKIDNDGVFTATAVETTNAADPADWNAATKEQIIWESPAINDSSTYNHSGENITVREAGDYLLVYNDLLQSTAQRPNPRITVEINGAAYPGAEAKTHYIRSADGHNTASATMAILLEGLSANDVVTVSTQREGQTGTVGIEEFSNEAAIVGLIKKSSLDTASIASSPRITSFNGGRDGFQIIIQEFAQTVDTDSVAVTLNGQPVEVEVSSSGGVATVSHALASIPDSGSSHTIHIDYKDSGGGSHSADLGFTVTEVYSKVPAFFANNSVDTNSNGFVAHVSQISEAQSGATNLHGNNINNANRQLQGGYSDSDGNQYINEVGPDSANSWQLNPVDVSIVNFEQAAGSAGNFNDASGFTDALIPGIPGFNDSTDGIAAEFLTYLELDQGWHTFGVNSDDGFQVTMGPATQDLLAASVGEFNGGRGSADSIFEFYVEESGFYPTRLLWFEGTGGANVEFFSVVDGEKILINDRDNPNATKAYSVAQTRPYVSHFEPISGTLADEVAFTITNGNIKVNRDSVQLSVDGALVIPPNVKVDGNNITTSFKNPVPFAGGDHIAILTYTENSTPPVTRTVEHRFSTPKGIPAILEDDPTVYYRFGETDGTTAVSEVGLGINGTYASASGGALPSLGEERLAVGGKSGAVLFDAAAQNRVQMPDHAATNSGGPYEERTMELWFKARSLPASPDLADNMVIIEGGGRTRGITIYLQGTDNPDEAALYMNVWNRAEEFWGGTDGPEGPVYVGTEGIKAGETYHIAFVMDGDNTAPDSFEGTVTGYLNGEQFGQAPGVHLLYNHGDDYAIGGVWTNAMFWDEEPASNISAVGGGFYFDGWIDEVVFFGTALPADRIKAHYDAGNTEVPFTPEPPPSTGGGQVSSIALTDGSVVIEFEGTLKSSATVNGQYAPVAGATSPYSVAPDQSAQFYIAE